MSNRNLPVPIVPEHPKTREIARIWFDAVADNAIVVCIPNFFPDPFAWGMTFMDGARHIADAYKANGERQGLPESACTQLHLDVLTRIHEGFNAEFNKPTVELTGEIQTPLGEASIPIEGEGAEFTQAKAEKGTNARVLMCVPFPNGTPSCAQCGNAEITHTIVYEVTVGTEVSQAFGCVCAECAKGVEVEFEPGAN